MKEISIFHEFSCVCRTDIKDNNTFLSFCYTVFIQIQFKVAIDKYVLMNYSVNNNIIVICTHNHNH